MRSFQRDMERVYSLIAWKEDLESEDGKERFNESYRLFKSLFSHKWIRDLLRDKHEINLIDVCSGTGVGGIAFSKVLLDEGYKVNLTLNDIRSSALYKGKRYAKKFLNIDVKLVDEDSRRLYKLSNKYNIVLIYGLSTPHFNPFQLISLVSSISQILYEDGILIVEEYDRVYSVYLTRRYEYLVPEDVSENRVVFSIHKDYDPVKGIFRRLYIDILSREKIFLDLRFWDLSSVACILWVFFKDVDFYSFSKRKVHGFLLGRFPRYINAENYSSSPTILQR